MLDCVKFMGCFMYTLCDKNRKYKRSQPLEFFFFSFKNKTNGAPKDDLASLLKKDHQSYFFFFLFMVCGDHKYKENVL